jgi:hypothetical protein
MFTYAKRSRHAGALLTPSRKILGIASDIRGHVGYYGGNENSANGRGFAKAVCAERLKVRKVYAYGYTAASSSNRKAGCVYSRYRWMNGDCNWNYQPAIASTRLCHIKREIKRARGEDYLRFTWDRHSITLGL